MSFSTEVTDPVPRPAPAKALSPQFGQPEPGVSYRDRPTAFGVAERHGQIAMVCVTRDSGEICYDLPGGAIEPGESELRALAREFVEETGLIVSGDRVLAHADQYMVKADGEPVNNRAVLMTTIVEGYDPAQKIEEDHKLVWHDPVEALEMVRLESHAWAIACYLRLKAREAQENAA